MDAKEFIALLSDHEKVKEKSVEELKKLSLAYPYSQPVQLLYTIRLSQSSEYLFNRQLGKTSILTSDRTVLFDLFEREEDNVIHDAQEVPPTLSQPVEPQVRKVEEEPIRSEPQLEEHTDEQRLSASLSDHIPEKEEPTEAKPPAAEPTPVAGEQSVKDKVKAILEENRRLREKYEGGAKEESGINRRITEIREKLDQLKEKTGTAAEYDNPVAPIPETAPEPDNQPQEVDPAPVAEETPIQADEPPIVEQALEDALDKAPLEEELTVDESAMISEGQEFSEPALVDDVEEIDDEIEEEEIEERVIQAEQVTEEAPPALPDEKIFLIDDERSEAIDIREVEGEEYSFSGWLQRLHAARTEEPEDPAEEPDTAHGPEQMADQPEQEESLAEEPETDEPEERPGLTAKFELFDSFVEKLPELKRRRPESVLSHRQEEELSDEESTLVTETLARVYVKQKHYDKAIKAYEILRLKYPEKSGFFADRIFEIKNLGNSKD